MSSEPAQQSIDARSTQDPGTASAANRNAEQMDNSQPALRANSFASSWGIPSYYHTGRNTGLSQRMPAASSVNAPPVPFLSGSFPSYYNTSIPNYDNMAARPNTNTSSSQSISANAQRTSSSSASYPSYYNTSIANNANAQRNPSRSLTPRPGPDSSSSSGSDYVPSYYYDVPPTGQMLSGFPMPQHVGSVISSSPASVHNSSYYRAPSANSRTGMVPMPYYNPALVNNSAPVAGYPMPMIYPRPFIGPAAYFSQPAMLPYRPAFAAVHMPSPHIPSGAASAAAGPVGGSTTQSVAVPSQSGSGEVPETGSNGEAGEAGEQDAAQEGEPAADPAPEPEPKEKTPEEIKFEKIRALKMRLIEELKDGGVIMDVDKPSFAVLAQRAGAKAVTIIGGSKSNLKKKYIAAQAIVPRVALKYVDAVAIPSVALVRPGNTREARALEKVGVDMIDESSRLDDYISTVSVDRKSFTTPFIAGAANLTEALQLIDGGAAIIRTTGNYDTGDCRGTLQALFRMRDNLEELKGLSDEGVDDYVKILGVSRELVLKTKELGRLPVPYYAAGGIATPSDVSQARLIGCDGVFTELSIFKGFDPERRAAAIVSACKDYKNAKLIAELSRDFRPEPKPSSG